MQGFIRKIFCKPLWKTGSSAYSCSSASSSSQPVQAPALSSSSSGAQSFSAASPESDPGRSLVAGRRPLFQRVVRAAAVLLFVAASLIIILDWLDKGSYQEYANLAVDGESGACNVSGIFIWGDIVTFSVDDEALETASEDIVWAIDDAAKNKDIKAILIEIDSPGGYPVAAEEIAAAIKRAGKPTIAIIREYGNSAAYWVASAADMIFASRNSELGSIGISGSYLDYSEKNKKEGIEYIDIAAGRFKNTGDPDRSLSQEEKELLERDINILQDNFIAAVAENRQMDIAVVRDVADGSTMLGQMALEKGLIDRLGTSYDAVDYLNELLGEEVDVCWY